MRKSGREYCQTEGSEHYKAVNALEPMDLIIAKGLAEDFCLANIIKYASRFKQTQNLKDLRKISDYAHILCGFKLELSKKKEPVYSATFNLICMEGVCVDARIESQEGVEICKKKNYSDIPEWSGICVFRRYEGGTAKC